MQYLYAVIKSLQINRTTPHRQLAMPVITEAYDDKKNYHNQKYNHVKRAGVKAMIN